MDDPHERDLLMPRHSRTVAALVAILAASCLNGDARVFWRRASGESVLERLETMGARAVYAAAMRINGKAVHMTVLHMDRMASEAARPLTGLRPAGLFTAPGTVVTSHRDNAARLVSVDVQSPDASVVFAVEPRGNPATQAQPPVAAYPGSRHVFTGQNDQTGVHVAIGTTSADAIVIRRHYSDALPSAGWKPVLVQRTYDETGHGMDVYLRDNAICCIVTDASSFPGETRVTAICKPVNNR
jgi:hypothetical protein